MSNSEELLNKMATAHLEPHIKSEIYAFLVDEERELCMKIDDVVEDARKELIIMVHEAKMSFEDCHLMRVFIRQVVKAVAYDASEPVHPEQEYTDYYNDE
jgi:DNA replication initiation complex subunit (GINS family)